jgi:peptide-methionine (S)-S-oxide reductase
MKIRIAAFVAAAILTIGAGAPGTTMGESNMSSDRPAAGREVITLGGGCFWCLEAVFDDLRGVESVESGYSGGFVPDPGYKEVCTGETGHAEVVQITFDPAVISPADLLRVFFTIHDPTTLNRQGADRGTQYRSVIFYRSDEQKAAAEQVMREFADQKIWEDPIVTQLVAFEAFYKAEDYHQEYYANNAGQPYCRVVIAPKVAKFREHFRDKLKKAP